MPQLSSGCLKYWKAGNSCHLSQAVNFKSSTDVASLSVNNLVYTSKKFPTINTTTIRERSFNPRSLQPFLGCIIDHFNMASDKQPDDLTKDINSSRRGSWLPIQNQATPTPSEQNDPQALRTNPLSPWHRQSHTTSSSGNQRRGSVVKAGTENILQLGLGLDTLSLGSVDSSALVSTVSSDKQKFSKTMAPKINRAEENKQRDIPNYTLDSAPRPISTSIYLYGPNSPSQNQGTGQSNGPALAYREPLPMNNQFPGLIPASNDHRQHNLPQEKQGHARATDLNLANNSRDWSTPKIRTGRRPVPTDNYLLQARSPPQRQDTPHPLLVIMDLNECLLDRGKNRKGTSQTRPHLREFIKYCLCDHYPMVWSSASPRNVQSMTDIVFEGQRKEPVAIWNRTHLHLTREASKEKIQVYKRLKWVWKDHEIAKIHPNTKDGTRWDQTNTVLIDDSLEKAVGEPYNHILVPKFKKENKVPESKEMVLLRIIEYLEEAAHHQDVSSFIYKYPFQHWLKGTAKFDKGLAKHHGVATA